jgi:hypothetical protein
MGVTALGRDEQWQENLAMLFESNPQAHSDPDFFWPTADDVSGQARGRVLNDCNNPDDKGRLHPFDKRLMHNRE